MRIRRGSIGRPAAVLLIAAVVVSLVAGCGPSIEPTIRPGASAHPTLPSGFPLGSFAKDLGDPFLGRIRLVWTFGPDGRWSEVPFAIDGQTLRVPTVRGMYAIDGETVTITTDYPAGWGTSAHRWQVVGPYLWTAFVTSDVPEDAGWFEMLDDRPWTAVD
jgi:hypothetical protein